MYFIRTAESIEEAKQSLLIGKSVDKWDLIGEDAYSHFENYPYNQRPNVFHRLGFNMHLSKEGAITTTSILLMEKLLSEKPL